MPSRQAAPKPSYRIRNWKQYNDALVRRGSLTLWVDREMLQAWRYRGPSQRGAQFHFSDTAIECLLTLRSVYHLTLRATEGFAYSLFGLMDLDLPSPITPPSAAGLPPSGSRCRRRPPGRSTWSWTVPG